MGLAADFREFAVKGNAMDLAVGVIIGAAFAKIVDSIVNDLIMPIVGAIFGGLDFSSKFIVLGDMPAVGMTLAELKKATAPVFAYGSFLAVLLTHHSGVYRFSAGQTNPSTEARSASRHRRTRRRRSAAT